MDRSEVSTWAETCRGLMEAGEVAAALDRMRPVIAGRNPFPLLDLAGRIVARSAGANPIAFTALLDGLAATGEMGAWPLVSSALGAAYVPGDLGRAFAETRRYILLGNAWYVTDILGERVPGPALLVEFDAALALLESWRQEPSPWLRRVLGVAVHFYAKRERQQPQQVARLLNLLAPLFTEGEVAAIKGVGWGLKTIGHYYPALLVPWLREQLASRKPRALMLRKATVYLPAEVRAEFR